MSEDYWLKLGGPNGHLKFADQDCVAVVAVDELEPDDGLTGVLVG